MDTLPVTDTLIGFIGFGLIGGSIARGIKRARPDIQIMAYMRTRSKLEQARKDGIVDIVLDQIDQRISQCTMIILCTPVEYNAQYLKALKPLIKEGTVITDVGSTKTNIHQEVLALGMEDVFVGGHPMAGSEKTGYENSTDHLLENAYYIITPSRGCAQEIPLEEQPEQVRRLTAIAQLIGAIPLILDYREHDRVVAAVSHVPHLIASSLVNLVKDCDSPSQTMKQVAAGGFKDITRIASSSPEMWEQICMTNTEPIQEILTKYIASLNKILEEIRSRDNQGIYRLFESSRNYRSTFAERVKGPIEPSYEFSVDVTDEIGAISTISVILAAKGISIKNIGINNNRENGEGALKIVFYDKDSMEAAWERLSYYKYELFKI